MDFGPFRADFLAFTTDIVYCTVTTVSPDGRPRSRVMHPIFEVVDGAPRGWAEASSGTTASALAGSRSHGSRRPSDSLG